VARAERFALKSPALRVRREAMDQREHGAVADHVRVNRAAVELQHRHRRMVARSGALRKPPPARRTPAALVPLPPRVAGAAGKDERRQNEEQRQDAHRSSSQLEELIALLS
jgi:hypothetical protein